MGRTRSWFWFTVGGWRRCWGGGRETKTQFGLEEVAARSGQGVVPGWDLDVEECMVHLRAATPAVSNLSMVNVACQTDSLGQLMMALYVYDARFEQRLLILKASHKSWCSSEPLALAATHNCKVP